MHPSRRARPRGRRPSRRRYRNRFIAVYAVLGLTLVGAIVGARRPDPAEPGRSPRPPGRPGSPRRASTAKMTSADRRPRRAPVPLNGRGAQLVAVVPSAPKVDERHQGREDLGDRDPQDAAEQHRHPGLPVEQDVDVPVLRPRRRAARSRPARRRATRGRLVRREALEVALYTFKFVPSVDSIVAFMPPPPGQTTTTLLFLQKSNLKDQLSQPLNKTLTLRRPPLPTDRRHLPRRRRSTS